MVIGGHFCALFWCVKAYKQFDSGWLDGGSNPPLRLTNEGGKPEMTLPTPIELEYFDGKHNYGHSYSLSIRTIFGRYGCNRSIPKNMPLDQCRKHYREKMEQFLLKQFWRRLGAA